MAKTLKKGKYRVEYHPATRQFFTRRSDNGLMTEPSCIVIASDLAEHVCEDFIDYAEYHIGSTDGYRESASGLWRAWVELEQKGGSHGNV